MMHPDHFNFIVSMAKAFIAVSIFIYAFKIGRLTYEILYQSSF